MEDIKPISKEELQHRTYMTKCLLDRMEIDYNVREIYTKVKEHLNISPSKFYVHSVTSRSGSKKNPELTREIMDRLLKIFPGTKVSNDDGCGMVVTVDWT